MGGDLIMDKMKLKIKTSTGQECIKELPCNCSSDCFIAFSDEPYKEDPEFTNSWVIGSCGTHQNQLIIRADPEGHKHNPNVNPHINVDFRYWDETRKKHLRRNDIASLDMCDFIEIETECSKEHKETKKVDLRKIIKKENETQKTS